MSDPQFHYSHSMTDFREEHPHSSFVLELMQTYANLVRLLGHVKCSICFVRELANSKSNLHDVGKVHKTQSCVDMLLWQRADRVLDEFALEQLAKKTRGYWILHDLGACLTHHLRTPYGSIYVYLLHLSYRWSVTLGRSNKTSQNTSTATLQVLEFYCNAARLDRLDVLAGEGLISKMKLNMQRDAESREQSQSFSFSSGSCLRGTQASIRRQDLRAELRIPKNERKTFVR